MQPRTRVLVTFTFIIFLITSLYVFTDWFSQVTGYFTGLDEKTKLAQCLDGKNAQFYGTTYCADCEKQKDLFGRSFKDINYIDCGKNKENCPNIESIPAWYISDTFHYGLKNFTELRDLSGCVDE